MTNNVFLLGRIASEIDKDGNFTIQASEFTPDKGLKTESTIIPVKAWEGIAKSIKEYTKIDDMVGIKGSLINENNQLKVLIEKMTFLSKNEGEENEEENR